MGKDTGCQKKSVQSLSTLYRHFQIDIFFEICSVSKHMVMFKNMFFLIQWT